MKTVLALIAFVLVALLGYFIYSNFSKVPEDTGNGIEVIEANNSEEAVEKYLEEQLANINISDEDLKQALLSIQS